MTAGSSRRAVGDDAFPAWLGAVESRLDDLARVVGRPRSFANGTARDAAFTNPKAGDYAYVAGERQVYDGTGWLQYDFGWTTYGPTFSGFTIGNGTSTARYQTLGKRARLQWGFLLGSSSAVGTGNTFTVPSGFDAVNAGAFVPPYRSPHGQAWFLLAAEHAGGCRFETATTVRIIALDPSSTSLVSAALSSTYPGTWAAGHSIFAEIEYDLANPYW